jgi:hypothetical protein
MNGHRSCGLVRGVLGVLGRGRVVSSCVVWGVPAVVDTGLCDNSGFRVVSGGVAGVGVEVGRCRAGSRSGTAAFRTFVCDPHPLAVDTFRDWARC